MRQFVNRHFRGNSFLPKRVTPIVTLFLKRVSTDRSGRLRTLKLRKSPCFSSFDGRPWTFLEGLGRRELVPAEGFEPPTYGLQNRCTTTVLSRHGSAHIITASASGGLPKSIASPARPQCCVAAPGLRRRPGRQFLAQ